MTLYENIIAERNKAMKAKDVEKTNALKLVMADVLRRDKTPEVSPVTDDEVMAVIKKLVKGEKQMLEQTGAPRTPFLDVLEAYLPTKASEAEIKEWISSNLSLDGIEGPARMRFMKDIMSAFKGNADGNVAKKALMEA